MAEEIEFNKNVFDKNTYSKVINTSFTQLGVTPISEQINNQPTVDDFFEMYNDLFYNIPEKGEINSHEFLIKKSSEYIGFEANQEEIGDATLIVPLIKEYMEIGVKNDDLLIKMAALAQRAMSNQSSESLGISDEEKQQLLDEINKYKSK